MYGRKCVVLFDRHVKKKMYIMYHDCSLLCDTNSFQCSCRKLQTHSIEPVLVKVRC